MDVLPDSRDISELCHRRRIRDFSPSATFEILCARDRNCQQGTRGSVQCGWDAAENTAALPLRVTKGSALEALSPFHLTTPPRFLANFQGVPADILGRPLSLELTWQSAKVSQSEVVDGEVSEAFFMRRCGLLTAGEARRGYISAEDIAGAVLGGNHLLQWVESRCFYCAAYAEAASSIHAFLLLDDLLSAGYNLLLIGPDGFPLTDPLQDYLSTEAPFGHERVLVAMLQGNRVWEGAVQVW